MRKIVSFFFLFFIITARVFAVSAYPHPIEVIQPDGSKLTIILKGDENLHWATSEDSYTLLLNKDGFYEYAILDDEGNLYFSGILARNINERSNADISFLNTITTDLRYSDAQISLKQQIYENRNSWMKTMEENGESGNRAITGARNFPVILVDFQGKPFTKTKAEFEALLNQPGYNISGAPGSLRDYWQAASYGQLDFTCDVYGPYTLANSINYYDDACYLSGYLYGDPRNMAKEAAQLAYNDGCDFSLYDYDNDGNVDGMHIIFAGYGQESGAPYCNSIWSHAWNFSPLYLNGKLLSKYSCSPELRGISGSDVTYIGVVAHELGHILGFPDFYDTDYAASGGNSVHLDAWCLMASGSWNDSGRTPSFPSAWCRDHAGWIPEQIISTPMIITLPNPQLGAAIYRINTKTNNEYFLVENRQREGWDYYIPASGMLIYHVDRNYYGWNNNCINCVPGHRGCYLKQANCANLSTCLHNYTAYPGTGNNTSFTDYSMPDSKSWGGANTGKPITDITHDTTNRTITFEFMGGEPSPQDNAFLANLTVSDGTLSPPFDPNITFYSVHVECPVSNITVTGYADDIYATVFGNVTDAPINIGSNFFVIKVTAEDNLTTMQYYVELFRHPTPAIHIEMQDAICQGDSYIFFDQIITEAGIYVHNEQEAENCIHHIYHLTLTVNPVNLEVIDAVIYAGETYDFYGDLLTQTGVYYKTFQNIYGCDSIIQLNLTVVPLGYFIITAIAGPNGTITPAGLVPVQQSSTITFYFEPDPGYRVESLFVNGKSQNCNNGYYTFNNVRDNHTIEVYFTTIAFTITATAGPNGTINPGGVVYVQPGGSETFTFTPDLGYRILEVLVNGKKDNKALKDGFITIKNVKENHTVHVTFISVTNPSPLGIDENESKKVVVYNISNHIFIKNETGVALKSVEIFDMMGRVVYQGAITDKESVITLDVAAGMYCVRIISENNFTSISKISIIK